jgi:hypothetical protein
MLLVVVGVLAVALIAAGIGLFVQVRAQRALKKRFSQVVDADAEATRIVEEAKRVTDRLRADMETALRQREAESARSVADMQATVAKLKAEAATETANRNALSADYSTAKVTFDRLNQEVRQLEENLEDISYGLYKPHYTFDTPEALKRELEKIHEKQKEMIRLGRAASFAVAWTVGGSTREGAKMQKQYTKLLLRAFNGECDAAVAKVTWNNASKMEERIQKAFDTINELGSVMTVSISPTYRDLALAELRLEHELEEKKRAIAEEQRRIREQMREEERAQREAEKAQSEAEAEEARFEKALEKARLELAKSRGEEHQRLNAKILDLEKQVAEARAKSERAKSLAQLTKAGYVYVISNIGSFGDSVFKIGMTRRLDPMDRVKELGDASVPFPFDVHAMVYSQDAPGLEYAIHQEFADRSVNLVNMRKEFFQVDLTEVERFAAERGLNMSFTKLAEAREYRETVEIRRKRSGAQARPVQATYPESLPSAT